MKKRLLTLLLAAAVCVTALPVNVYAKDGESESDETEYDGSEYEEEETEYGEDSWNVEGVESGEEEPATFWDEMTETGEEEPEMPEEHVEVEADTADFLYLSELSAVFSSVGWGSLMMDADIEGDVISLKTTDGVLEFEKGIGAHAEATLIYDVREAYAAGYRYFETYYGVDSSRGSNGSVKFFMYTTTEEDVNSALWTACSDVDSSVMKGNTEARFVEISLEEDTTYLKIYMDPDGSNGSDHSVLGDAKFAVESRFSDFIEKTEVYDAQLKEYYQQYGTDYAADPSYEKLLLKRDLVDKVGYFDFQFLLEEDPAGYEEMLTWLFEDTDFMKMYLTGGNPGGNYLTGGSNYQNTTPADPYADTLRVMYRLWNEYREDFDNHDHNELYRKMIICLSLTNTGNIKFWYNTSGSGTIDTDIICPDPVRRYAIYKDLYDEGLLVDYFEDLEVPEMRYVFASTISDGEIEWASNLAKERNYNTNCYSWMYYQYGNYYYHADKYYNEETWGEDPTYNFVEKYNLNEYGITNEGYGETTEIKYPKLWLMFEEGGVCWNIANFCQNIWSSYGRPCLIAGSMGTSHEIYMAYNRTEDGNGRWTIENACGGNWNNTHRGAYANGTWRVARWMNDWGVGEEFNYNNASYICMAQAAINEYDKFVDSEVILMLVPVFEGDYEEQEHIYDQALEAEDFNFDAWYGLVKQTIADEEKTDADKAHLAERMTEALVYYPLPMDDLLNLLRADMTSNVYIVVVNTEEKRALRKAQNVTDEESLQAYSVQVIANWLLGENDMEIGSFSFDGEHAGEIILSDQFPDPEYWEYSLDGGQTWSAIVHDETVADLITQAGDEDIVVSNPNVVKLTEEEIAQVNEEDNILIRFMQVPDTIHTIDIEKAGTPVIGSTTDVNGLYPNIWENQVINATNVMEWRAAGNETWTSFADETPDLTAGDTYEIRYRAYDNYTAGDAVTLPAVTETDDSTREYSYIPLSRITIADATVQTSSQRAVSYALDGSIYSFYQSKTTTDPISITLELDEPAYLSKLVYQCNLGNTANGQVREAEVYLSLDGETWVEADYDDYDDVISWGGGNSASGKSPKEVTFAPTEAKYIKLVATSCTSNFMSVGELRLYENLDLAVTPETEIIYSPTDPTNGDVTATLITDGSVAEITNNDGSNTYTFTENGSFTFAYVGVNGKTYTATAVVDWIDREEPDMLIQYEQTEDGILVLLCAEEEIQEVEGWTLLPDGMTLMRLFTPGEYGGEEIVITDLAGNAVEITLDPTFLAEREEETLTEAAGTDDAEVFEEDESGQNGEVLEEGSDGGGKTGSEAGDNSIRVAEAESDSTGSSSGSGNSIESSSAGSSGGSNSIGIAGNDSASSTGSGSESNSESSGITSSGSGNGTADTGSSGGNNSIGIAGTGSADSSGSGSEAENAGGEENGVEEGNAAGTGDEGIPMAVLVVAVTASAAVMIVLGIVLFLRFRKNREKN